MTQKETMNINIGWEEYNFDVASFNICRNHIIFYHLLIVHLLIILGIREMPLYDAKL